jgi:putative ABC transport system ATP-binding protein
MAEEPMLEAKGIVKYLGEGAGRVQALKGVNLDLMPGELTLLMGPSGSGKTTLLSILGCILTPNSGSLRLARNEASGLSAEGLADLRRKHVGFVFQSYNLVPTLTATENVMLALDLRGTGLSRAPALAAEALRQVGLSHRAHAMPSKMSGGEKQRVAIARVLLKDPRILILDEATSALDTVSERLIQAALARLMEGRTTIAIAHRLSTILRADQILVMSRGRIVERGTHDELIRQEGLYAKLSAEQFGMERARD